MPDPRRARCQRCKRHRDECGGISWKGLCTPCAVAAVTSNVDDLYNHKGDGLLRWRRGMVACAGGVLLDAEPPRK